MSEDTSPAAVIDDDIIEKLYQLSQRYHGNGLYEPAIRLLEFLIRHDPVRAGFHFALGKAFHGRSQHREAVQSYRRALKLGLPEIDVHLYLGQCLIFSGRFVEAGTALRQFIGLAEAQAGQETLAQQVQGAHQLLDHIVMPRLQAAGGTRPPSGAAAPPPAGASARRHESLESTS